MKILLSSSYISIRAKPTILSDIEQWLISNDIKTEHIKTYKGEDLKCYARQNTLYEILLKLSFDYDIEIIWMEWKMEIRKIITPSIGLLNICLNGKEEPDITIACHKDKKAVIQNAIIELYKVLPIEYRGEVVDEMLNLEITELDRMKGE